MPTGSHRRWRDRGCAARRPGRASWRRSRPCAAMRPDRGKVVAIERIVEQVRAHRSRDRRGRPSGRSPASRALAMQDVIVMKVAMQDGSTSIGFGQAGVPRFPPLRRMRLSSPASRSARAFLNRLAKRVRGVAADRRGRVRRTARTALPSLRPRSAVAASSPFSVELVDKQPVAGIFEQHAAARRSRAAAPRRRRRARQVMRTAQFVRDVVEWLERLDRSPAAVLAPHFPDAAARRFRRSGLASLTFQRPGSAGASIQCLSPSIRSMFCTAAPDAPLPRLS